MSFISIPGRSLSPQATPHCTTRICSPGLLSNPHVKILGLSLGKPDGAPLAGLAAFGQREPSNPIDAKNTILACVDSVIFHNTDAPRGTMMEEEWVVPFPPTWCLGHLGQPWCLPASGSQRPDLRKNGQVWRGCPLLSQNVRSPMRHSSLLQVEKDKWPLWYIRDSPSP